jgi:hypothetical protein
MKAPKGDDRGKKPAFATRGVMHEEETVAQGEEQGALCTANYVPWPRTSRALPYDATCDV